MKDRIIKASDALFAQYGFSKTTADEIAQQAGMSKRTLYKYFESKLQILDTLIEGKLAQLRTELDEILKQKTDFPEKMRRITTGVAVSLSGLSHPFLEDLQRNTPQIWEKVSEFRRQMVHVFFPMLLDEGIKEGHFKKSLNKGVAVLLMMNAMEIIINPKLISALPDGLVQQVPVRPEELFDKIIEIIYDGIHQGESIF